MESWHPVFEKASEILYNATERQVQIGRVEFYRNHPQAAALADVWITLGVGGAHSPNRALGQANRHILLTQLHKSIKGENRGQFSLAHELGHYLFDLWDEYEGNTTLASAGTAELSLPDLTGNP